MNKHMFLYICLLFLSVAAHIKGQHNKFVFDYITNNSGLTHNTVYDICQDEKGFMWFATEVGLNRYDGQNIKQYRHSPDDPHSLPSYTITSLVFTTDNKLFVGTNDGLALYRSETDNFDRVLLDGKSIGRIYALSKGFDSELLISTETNGTFVYNYETKHIVTLKTEDKLLGITVDKSSYWTFSLHHVYRFDKFGVLLGSYQVSALYPGISISCIMTDEKGNVWIGTFDDGLLYHDTGKDKFIQADICKNTKIHYIRTIEEGEKNGEYWLGTENGLYIINIKMGECEHYVQSFNNMRKTINDNAIYRIYRNKQGTFFAGTYFGGVNIINHQDIGFNAILPKEGSNYLPGKAISTMAKAPDGHLWIATEDAGIAIFDNDTHNFKHLQFSAKNPHSISSNNVHALLMDGDICWVGHFMGGVSKVDINSGKAKRYVHDTDNPSSLNNNFVFALHFLSPDSILVGSLSGVDILNKRTETFSRFRENEFADCFIYDIFTAPDGKVWFCTYEKGIYILDKANNGLMTHYQMGDGSGLSSNSIISYLIDSKKQIWIGTRDAGMFKYIREEERFEKIKSNMLVDNVVYGIIEDNEGFFWVSTNKGISRLNFQDSIAVHFNVKHGLSGNQHNYKSYFKDNGIIYFGSVTGLTWFDPKTILMPKETPSVYFTNLRISNEIIRPDSTGVLDQQIDFTKHLILKYNQNSFTLDYASINYFSNDIVYQYYLEGLENTWSPATERTQANYTNIVPGDYIFHIRATNMISGSVSEERSIMITIKPPIWASWYAYLLYSFFAAGVFYYFYRTYKNRQHEKMALTIEKIEKENLKLLHQHKMNFFTYISHEFKTPLSIIVASIEMLSSQNRKTDAKSHDDIQQSIKRSANKLLSLVSQLMEFRKIETDHAVIHITKGNVIDFANQIIDIYRPLLEKKEIRLDVKVNYTRTDIFFDFDKLEKIITNLMTNAIKYTPQNGSIDFTLKVDGNMLLFSVKDSGGGISEKKKDKIFEAFYSDDFSNDIVESSGIGLALTASLVKLLKGQITVDSKQGKGSCFKVSLPYETNPAPLSVAEIHTTDSRQEDTIHEEISAESTTEEIDADTSNTDYTLVIAEDNKDLLMLLQQHFKDKYRVKCLENGQEAWEYINRKMPDIIITDIMMPVMSGIELCQKIKTDVNLCHIPVIMLTAKDTKEAKLEGLQVGADAYISKPFSMAELEIRLNNIINNQKALKIRLKELARFEGFDIPATNHEQAFVEKLFSIIQNNMEKNELDVQFIAGELNISRSNLHNKMKAMNMNIPEFINTVRINKAKELMHVEEATFAEIAYKIGYNDPAYFSRIFKKHTGKTPKEYRQEIKEK